MTKAAHEALLARIALDYLHIPTLTVRHSDGLDFHDVGVLSVKAALQAAFDAGQRTSSAKQ